MISENSGDVNARRRGRADACRTKLFTSHLSCAIPVNNDSCLPVYRLMFRHFEGGSSGTRF